MILRLSCNKEKAMKRQEVAFRNFLKTRDLRFTPERQIILQAIVTIDGHFDVESLFYWIKNNNKHTSRATIYRAIPLFIESGIIKESLRCHDRIHYESSFNNDHHDHLICIKCGAIIEFKDEKIEELQERVCKKYNFKPKEHKLGIRGFCSKCQNK